MIDLTISNNKLFYRGVDIVAKLAKVSTEKATDSILRSIYKVDKVRPIVLQATHISFFLSSSSSRPSLCPYMCPHFLIGLLLSLPLLTSYHSLICRPTTFCIFFLKN